MVRKLKFHEQKLLKKVDFYSWKIDNNANENKVLKKYQIKRREDYAKYNKLSREVRDIAQKIAQLKPSDHFKNEACTFFLEKLFGLGLIKTKTDLDEAGRMSASSFCRRRLPVVMVEQRLSQSVKSASDLVEQGHVRVGPEMIKDPAFLVSRNLEDFVTWVDSSAIRKHVLEYNDLRDDFEM